MIYYLKASSRNALEVSLSTAGIRYVRNDGTPEVAVGCSLDIIGAIPPDMACHANLMTESPLPQETIDILPIMAVPPSDPVRTFWTEIPVEP